MMAIERAVLKGSIEGTVEIRNIFTAEVTESGGDTSALLWETYMDMLLGQAENLVSSDVHFYGYDVYDRDLGHWILKDEVTVDYTGLVTGQPLLNAAALVFIAKAEGLRHVGRKFLGSLGEAMIDGNLIESTAVAPAALWLLYYISPVEGIGGGTLQPGVIDQGDFFHAFVGGAVSAVLGTMRRRKPGVGI
jgi:hypothetical protein